MRQVDVDLVYELYHRAEGWNGPSKTTLLGQFKAALQTWYRNDSFHWMLQSSSSDIPHLEEIIRLVDPVDYPFLSQQHSISNAMRRQRLPALLLAIVATTAADLLEKFLDLWVQQDALSRIQFLVRTVQQSLPHSRHLPRLKFEETLQTMVASGQGGQIPITTVEEYRRAFSVVE
jgi:hypothetical protein